MPTIPVKRRTSGRDSKGNLQPAEGALSKVNAARDQDQGGDGRDLDPRVVSAHPPAGCSNVGKRASAQDGGGGCLTAERYFAAHQEPPRPYKVTVGRGKSKGSRVGLSKQESGGGARSN